MCLFLAGEEASGVGSVAHCVHEVVRAGYWFVSSASPTPLSLHKLVGRGLQLENSTVRRLIDDLYLIWLRVIRPQICYSLQQQNVAVFG